MKLIVYMLRNNKNSKNGEYLRWSNKQAFVIGNQRGDGGGVFDIH
jgi:hypothetical protein